MARVSLRPGGGEWRINGRELDDYFPRPAHRVRVEDPIRVAGAEAASTWRFASVEEA